MEKESEEREGELENPGEVSCLDGKIEEYFVPEGFGGISNRKTLAWWRTPFNCYQRKWWLFRWNWRCCCCCCCCDKSSGETPLPQPVESCNITLGLLQNAYGPGKSIALLLVPYGGYITAPYTTISAGSRPNYRAEFTLVWNARSSSGQATVKLELISGPGSSRVLATNRGANDRFLFSTNFPGTYLFRAECTSSGGKTCFATYQVTV